MNTYSISRCAVLAASLVCLVGCSTPQPALDQANHSTRLMSLLEIQLKEFRRVQSTAELARLDSLRSQREVIDSVTASAQLDLAASNSAGDTTREALSSKMLADADAVSAVYSRVRSSKETYDQKLTTLLSPLPSTTAAMTDAQKKMAEMGTELSRETRLSELLAFAKEIKANVDENKKKIQAAEDTAAATDQAVKAAVQADASNSSVQPPTKKP